MNARNVFTTKSLHGNWENILKNQNVISIMEYENKSATREILDVCNQLQANFDPNKIDWTMDELYQKYFAIQIWMETGLASKVLEKIWIGY